MDPRAEILIKGGLSLATLVIVLWRHVGVRRLGHERAGVLLAAAAVAAVIAYFNFGGLHGRSGIHYWEQFHYFLGSKYFPELGYDGLYAASLVAEQEWSGSAPRQSHVRDLRTNNVVPTEWIADHEAEVRSRFSPERWRAFVRDTAHFLEANRYDYILKIRRDHGYNPTPTWTFTARLFSRWLPATSDTLRALAWIDPLLLAVMFTFIFRTWGSRIGCLALVVFGLGYPWRFDWVGGAFLRQDWLAAVGVAVCLLVRRRYAGAGALLAYAAMVRVFPGGFLAGLAVVAVRDLVERRPVRWFFRMWAGFAAGAAGCLIAGTLIGSGVAAWPMFVDNLSKHHGTWLTNNVGLKNVLLYDAATMRRDDVEWQSSEPWIIWQGKMNRLQRERRLAIAAAAIAVLALAAAAAWRLDAAQAAVLGVAVVFAAVVLTCYYWVMLLLVPLGHGRWRPTAGWMAINVGLYALHLLTPAFEMRYGLMSWALLIFFLAWLGPDAWRTIVEGTAPYRSLGST